LALRNQPYFPLYVQDYLTDEKLNMCSASSQGVYIKIMCIMHKSKNYGTILLKQKDKQSINQTKNFVSKLVKLLPFDYDTIYNALIELIEEEVLYIEEDNLCQKRMIKDNNLSLIRSNAGKKGGNPNLKKHNLLKQKDKQITEDENDIEDEVDYENEVINKKGVKTDFPYQEVLDTWNYFAERYNLSKVTKLTESRKKKIRQRLKNNDFNIIEILRKVETQSFLLGENKNGWVITFDFIIKNEDNYIKILEEKYGTHKQNNNGFTAKEWRELSESIANDDRYI